MSQFEEPTVLATFDRSWKDKKERLQLERGSYQGRPTFALRATWQAEDGSWRWSQAKPSQSSGKCWQSMSLKARELRALADALIAAADDADEANAPEQRRVKDTPKRQAERDRFDAASSVPRGGYDDSSIPF